MTEIRYSTLADFIAFDKEPPPYTCRAVSAVVDGKVAMIGGIAFTKQYTFAFMDASEDAPKKAIMKATKKIASEIFPLVKGPLVAFREDKWKNSHNYLLHIGFEQVAETLYVWKGN